MEELSQSDLLLHVVDITHPKVQEQTSVVDGILEDLGLGDCPKLLVANKTDLLPQEEQSNAESYPDPWNVQAAVPVSAAKGWNLDQLLRKTESLLMNIDRPLTVSGINPGGR